MTTKIHLTAFLERQGNFIFVAVPDERGRYVRTDRSVALVACPVCASIVGEPCKAAQTVDSYGGTTHYRRRMEAKRRFPGVPVDDVIAPGHHTTPDEYMEPAA